MQTIKHKEIRKIILDKFSLEKIKLYGKSFQGVFSDIVYVQIKNSSIKNNQVHLILQNLSYCSQQKFIDNNFQCLETEPLAPNSNNMKRRFF